MKINILKSGKRSRHFCLIAGLVLLLSVGLLNSALAGKAQEIDSKADVALERLYKVDGGREFAEKAKALTPFFHLLVNPKRGLLILI
jgi:hypothetical protein